MRFLEVPALITEDIEDPNIVDIMETITASISGTTLTIDGDSKVSGETTITLTGDVTVSTVTTSNIRQPSIHKITIKTNGAGNFTYVPNNTVTASSVSTTTKTGSDLDILLITTSGGDTYLDLDIADYVSPAANFSNVLTGFNVSDLTSAYGTTAKLYKPDGTLLTTVTSATTGSGIGFGSGVESSPGDVIYKLEVTDDIGRKSTYNLPRKWINYAMETTSTPGFQKFALSGNDYTSTVTLPSLGSSSTAKVYRTTDHGYMGIKFKIQGRNAPSDDWVDIANADENDEVLAFGDYTYQRVWVKPTAKATTTVSSSNVVTLTLSNLTEENVTTSFTGADPFEIDETSNVFVFEETAKIGTVPYTVTVGTETYTNAVTATTEEIGTVPNTDMTAAGPNMKHEITVSSLSRFHEVSADGKFIAWSNQSGVIQVMKGDPVSGYTDYTTFTHSQSTKNDLFGSISYDGKYIINGCNGVNQNHEIWKHDESAGTYTKISQTAPEIGSENRLHKPSFIPRSGNYDFAVTGTDNNSTFRIQLYKHSAGTDTWTAQTEIVDPTNKPTGDSNRGRYGKQFTQDGKYLMVSSTGSYGGYEMYTIDWDANTAVFSGANRAASDNIGASGTVTLDGKYVLLFHNDSNSRLIFKNNDAGDWSSATDVTSDFTFADTDNDQGSDISFCGENSEFFLSGMWSGNLRMYSWYANKGATLAFTNPTLSLTTSDVTISSAKLYRDDVLFHTYGTESNVVLRSDQTGTYQAIVNDVYYSNRITPDFTTTRSVSAPQLVFDGYNKLTVFNETNIHNTAISIPSSINSIVSSHVYTLQASQSEQSAGQTYDGSSKLVYSFYSTNRTIKFQAGTWADEDGSNSPNQILYNSENGYVQVGDSNAGPEDYGAFTSPFFMAAFTPTSSTLGVPDGTTRDLTTQSSVYIYKSGTYTANVQTSDTFAYLSNVATTQALPIRLQGSDISAMGTTNYTRYGVPSSQSIDVEDFLFNSSSNINPCIDFIHLTNSQDTFVFDLESVKTINKIRIYAGNTTPNWASRNTGSIVKLYNGSTLVYTSPSLTFSRSSPETYYGPYEEGKDYNTLLFTTGYTNIDKITVETPSTSAALGRVEVNDFTDAPSLTFDGFNKLSIENITQTSSTLKYGSNTYDTNTASNVYVTDAGEYILEAKDANTFVMSNVYVGDVDTIPEFTVAFHHGAFSASDYSSAYSTVAEAATAGFVYSDTPAGTYTWGTLARVKERENPDFTANSTLHTDYSSTYGWTTNSGWQVSAKDEFSSTYEVWKAFSKTYAYNNNWLSGSAPSTSSPQWLKIKYPSVQVIKSYVIRARDNSSPRFPTAWKLQGSNNDSDWTDIGTEQTQTVWGQGRSKSFDVSSNTTAYQYYRLRITGARESASLSNSDYVAIGQWILFTETSGSTVHDKYTRYTWTPAASLTADVFMVAGGGGGGSHHGGGGGGGGVVYNTNQILSGQKSIVIGNGGEGGYGTGTTEHRYGLNGKNTYFSGLNTAIGGGGGSGQGNVTSGGSGGSGGGSFASTVGGSPTTGQGYKGGDNVGNDGAAGGGGAGGAGSNNNGRSGGNGGLGINYTSTFGTTYGDSGWFASGGGGGSRGEFGSPGSASQGGGTSGSGTSSLVSAADSHTGGGGGGSGYDGGNTSQIGGKGGSGIVIIKKLGPTNPPALTFDGYNKLSIENDGNGDTGMKNVTISGGPWNNHTFKPDDNAQKGKFQWDLWSQPTGGSQYVSGDGHSLEYVVGYGWYILNQDGTGFGDVSPTSATTGTYVDVNGVTQNFSTNLASSSGGVLTIAHTGGTMTVNESDFFEGGVFPPKVGSLESVTIKKDGAAFATTTSNTVYIRNAGTYTAEVKGSGAYVTELSKVVSGDVTSNQEWKSNETQIVYASDGSANNNFGRSCAMWGSYMVVGSFEGESNTQGAIYIYKKESGTWTFKQKISGEGANDYFSGYGAVDIHEDTIIVGAYKHGTNNNTGKAYVYTRSGETWSLESSIVSDDLATDDKFGISVSVHGDYAVVGAQLDDGPNNSGAGYIFYRNGTSWSQQQKLNPGADDENVGTHVSIYGDYVVLSGKRSGSDLRGRAHVYKRSGTTWGNHTVISNPNPASNDAFSERLSITDGYVAIGSDADDPGGTSDAGQVYVFKHSGTNDWTLEATLEASDKTSSMRFASGISMTPNVLVVGAHQESTGGANAGAVYVFERSGTIWTEVKKVVASDAAAGDRLGIYVGVNNDGSSFVAGAYGESTNGASAGAAYVYEKGPVGPNITYDGKNKLTVSGTNYEDTATVTDPNGSIHDIGTAKTMYVKDIGDYVFKISGTDKYVESNVHVSSVDLAGAPTKPIDFDGYNKLTLIDAGSNVSANVTYFSNTYELGSANVLYINGAGTYNLEMSGSNVFALSSNFVGTISSLPDTLLHLDFESGGLVSTGLNTTQYKYGSSSLYRNNDSVTVSNDGSYNIGNTSSAKATIMLWVRPESYPDYNGNANRIIVAADGRSESSTSYKKWAIVLREHSSIDEVWQFHYPNSSNTDLKVSYTPTDVPVGAWYHVCVTIESGSLKFYIDGVEVTSSLTGSKSDIESAWAGFNDDEGFKFCKTDANYLKGWVDDFKLFNSVLTLSEITAHMNASKLSSPSLTFDNYNKLTIENFTTTDIEWPPASFTSPSVSDGNPASINGITSTNSAKDAEWVISGASYGNGTYKASTTVAVHETHAVHGPFQMFNKVNGGLDTKTTTTNTSGEWTIELPSSIVLYKYSLHHGNAVSTSANYPKDWTIEGSNDGTTWVVIDTRSNETYASSVTGFDVSKREYTVSNNTTKYKHYKLNVSAINSGSYILIGAWRLFEINTRTATLTDPNGDTYSLGQTQNDIYIKDQGDYFLEVTNSDRSAVVKKTVGTISTAASSSLAQVNQDPPSANTIYFTGSGIWYNTNREYRKDTTQTTSNPPGMYYELATNGNVEQPYGIEIRYENGLNKVYCMGPNNQSNPHLVSVGSLVSGQTSVAIAAGNTLSLWHSDGTLLAQIDVDATMLWPTNYIIPSLNFDGYNKLSIENITPTSTTLTDPNGSSFDIGTASNVYIEHEGTYKMATGDATTFALVSKQVNTPALKPDYTNIYAGEYGGMVIDSDGKLYTWGNDGNNQSGRGASDRTPTHISTISDPVSNVWVEGAAGRTRIVKTSTDKWYMWGMNLDKYKIFGQTGDQATPVDVTSDFTTYFGAQGTSDSTRIIKVVTSASACSALAADGKVWSWGVDGNRNELGNNTTNGTTATPFKNITSTRTVIQHTGDWSSTGPWDGTLVSGAIYQYSITTFAKRFQIDYSTGQFTKVGTHTSYTWWKNGTQVTMPFTASEGDIIKLDDDSTQPPYDSEFTMGPLGTNTELSNITDICCLHYGKLALDSNGDVWQWGTLRTGSTGYPTKQTVSNSYVNISLDSGFYYTDYEYRVDPNTVQSSGYVIYTLYHLPSSTFASSGHNIKVQLSNNTWLDANSGTHPDTVTDNGTTVSGTRSDSDKQHQNPLFVFTKPSNVIITNSVTIIGIGAGYFTAYAWDAAGTIYSIGQGTEGQLGNGANVDQDSSWQTVTTLQGKTIYGIYGAGYSVFAHTSDGVYACGQGTNGRLGMGDNNNLNVFTKSTTLSALSVYKLDFGHGPGYIITTDGKGYALGYDYLNSIPTPLSGDKNVPTEASSLTNLSLVYQPPSLTYDTSNKLSIENLTPTSTTLTDPNGSSFDIGTASNVYIRDSGKYSIASKDANTFVLTSNTVTGTPTGTTYVYDSNTFTTPSQTYDNTKTITVSNVPSHLSNVVGNIYKGATAYTIHATTSSSNVIIKNTGSYVSVFTTATQAFLTNAIDVNATPTTTSDDNTIEDAAPIVTTTTSTSIDTTLAFHYGSFDSVYGDADVEEAANNGRIFDDTPEGTYDWGTLDSTPSTASNQTTYTWTPTSDITGADVLMVAGGGGGGKQVGGGGGAGGLLHHTNQTLSGQKTIVVGDGGIGGDYSLNVPASNGNNTTFTGFDNDAIAGGRGASYNGFGSGTGGSGGGGGGNSTTGQTGTSGQGNNGGSGRDGSWGGGGGGGAGAAGQSSPTGDTGGAGGVGVDKSTVFGTTYGDSGWFAGGGGGASSGTNTVGAGGQGGGGQGGNNATTESGIRKAGTKHTGGGGGGTRDGNSFSGGSVSYALSQDGGKGGSGIVLVKFTAQVTTTTTTGGIAGSTAVPVETTTDAPSAVLDVAAITTEDPILDLDFTTTLPRNLKRYNGLTNSSIGARFNRHESKKKRIEKSINTDTFSIELTANNASSPTTLTVTVANSKFVINGDETPTLGFIRGETYTFDQSDASNDEHPLVLATSEDGMTLYESGWVNSVFTVPYDVPDTIYYKCNVHPNMGGEINTTFGNAFSLGDFTVAANTHVSGEYTLATNYDGTTSNLYVNGDLITQTNTTIASGAKTIKIGEDYNGLIKNLKFWNYAKSFLFAFTSFITYSYTGSDQTISVPSGATHVKVVLKGAGGGHGYDSYSDAIGGTGGYTEAEIELPSGTTSLTLIVGQGGDSDVNTSKTYGGGGGSGNDGGATGGRGGGRTAIRIGSTEIATAGGGGGGSYNNSDSSKNPGFNGGGLIALGGTNPQGGGGTQTTGGSAGEGSSRNGEAGTQYEGGTGSITGTGWGGAGGGGGWYGGGGGGGLSGHHGAGGGGSGFAGRDGSTVLSGNERGSTSAYADTTQRSDSVNNCKYKNVKVLRAGGSAGQVGASGTINHGVAEIAWGSK